MEQLNLYQKLARIRKLTEVIQRRTKSFSGYYVSEDDLLAKQLVGMEKYDISLFPSIVPKTLQVTPISYTKWKMLKNGDRVEEVVHEVLVQADMEFTWVNNENPEERLTIPWGMVGQQNDASQSFGSALTYASRYFRLKFFNVATPQDDPDNWEVKKKQAMLEEEKVLIKATLDEIDRIIKDILKKNPDAREKISSVVKKYANKEGKISTINKSEDAVLLLNDLKQLIEKDNNSPDVTK